MAQSQMTRHKGHELNRGRVEVVGDSGNIFEGRVVKADFVHVNSVLATVNIGVP